MLFKPSLCEGEPIRIRGGDCANEAKTDEDEDELRTSE